MSFFEESLLSLNIFAGTVMTIILIVFCIFVIWYCYHSLTHIQLVGEKEGEVKE